MTIDSEELPSQSRVVRYVPYGRMRRDEDDNYLGPLPSAFEGRPIDDYLSVTWCEYFDGVPEQQLGCAIEALRCSNISVKAKACFCIAGTDEICAAIVDAGLIGKAVYHPEDDNRAHAGVYGIPPEDGQLLAQLADGAWREFLTKADADALPNGNCVVSAEIG